MRFYTQQHRFYCGVDLHARTMYLCILDGAGQVVYDKNHTVDPDAFLHAVTPFRDNLVVVERRFCWQWMKRRTVKMCVAQHRAETSQPNIAGAFSAKEVNSDPRVVRDEEGILQISWCALLTMEAMKWVRQHSDLPFTAFSRRTPGCLVVILSPRQPRQRVLV